MNPFETIDAAAILSHAKDVLRHEAGLRLALAYGSMAEGNPRPDSDMDLAVLFEHPMNAVTKMRLVADLQKATGRQIDLIDLYALNGTILRQILSKGKTLVRNDAGSLEQLLRRMIFNQADMMPYVKRSLTERQQRFAHG